MSTKDPTTNKLASTCLLCSHPLGQDSKDAGWLTCKEHRACAICDKPLQPVDTSMAYQKYEEDLAKDPSSSIDLIHPRCAIVSNRLATLDSDPTLSLKQSTYNYLNAARLMVDPDMNLSILTNENNAMIRCTEFIHTLDFDKLYATLKMMEACVATVNLALAQDKKKLKERAGLRDAEEFKRAMKEAKTSSRPVAEKIDSDEIALGSFMEAYGIKDRKTALRIKKDRDRAINELVKLGMPEKLVT